MKLKLSGLVGCGMLLAACGGRAAPPGKAPATLTLVKISYTQPTAGFSYLYLAQDEGLFAKYGLDSQLVNLSAPTDLQALLNNELQFAIDGGAAINAISGGANLTMIALPSNHYTQGIYAGPGVETVRDLVGASVGVTTPGQSADGMLHSVLKQEGVDAAQVHIVYLKDDVSILAALTAGTVRAGVLSSTSSAAATRQGLRLVLDASKLKLETVNAGPFVDRGWAQQHPDLVTGFLKGMMEGIKRAYDDPAATKKEIQKYTRVDDPASLDQAYQVAGNWSRYPTVSDAAMQNVIDLSTDEKVRAHKPSDFYDNSYLLKLQDFSKTLYPSGVPS